MRPVTDATPLIAANAVAFDTETTGLDVKEARILQLGGMALVDGALQAGDVFETLVDPGVPIPPRSTAIHGITGQMLRTAPGFAEAWPRFEAYCGGRLLVGYALGFDLAVLEREAHRAGLLWQAPRTLCVRMLAGLVNSHLPDASLEAIAAWLEVDTSGRHRATADARIAGEIFIALAPHLAERGIRTVAEAERASSLRSQALRQQAEAGWSEPFLRRSGAARHALEAIDPYAFRHRMREAATPEPVVVRDDIVVLDAARLMAERRISSLLLAADGEAGSPVSAYSIVTERDILRAVAARGSDTLAEPVSVIASKPVIAVAADAFFYQALGLMSRKRIRHLAVSDDGGNLAGVLSSRDFLKFRAGAAVDLQARIENARTPADLAGAWSRVAVIASALLDEETDTRIIAEIISGILCSITASACRMALCEMEAEGQGAPPVPFAVMVLGSGGRGESLLAADQDNAIIFSTGAPDGPEDSWFAVFAERFTDHLHTAAIPLCRGGVMARNPPWRGSAETWRQRVDGWVSKARPQDLLNVDIFYDVRAVYGEERLVTELAAHAWKKGAERVEFAKLLGESVRNIANPFTIFGGFRLDNGRLDLKLHGLFPISALARALAIRHHLPHASTRARLEALADLPAMPRSDLLALRDAHRFLLARVLEQQVEDIAAGIPLSNRIAVDRLTASRQKTLKDALKAVAIIPELVRSAMFAN
ncbi:MAG: DNA polymerase III subunit epsilon [Nitratireductor sp.]|nr:DNA polymerase III subunit epsilon [Nitratireductor sp.]